MPRCPNCSYILTLLEKRKKYKCAKCGKLFSQKEIDTKEFREYNKREKENDKIEFEKQLNLRRKTLKAKGLNPQEIQKKLKEWRAKYYQNHRETIRAKWRKFYKINSKRILKSNSEWAKKNSEKVRETKKKYKSNHLFEVKLNQRIRNWRRTQVKLFLELS